MSVATTTSASSRRALDDVAGRLTGRLGPALALVVYLVVVLTGATTSSLGVEMMREQTDAPLATMLGEPQGIRSDEYLTQTPIELSVLALGHSYHSPLSETGDVVFQLSSGQGAESIFFLESGLLRLGPWLPDANLFAAWRALPFLLLALTLPPLLRRMGATGPLSWLAFFLVVLAPTSLWWSFTPVRILAAASLGSFLLVKSRELWSDGAARARIATSLALAGVGGVVLAQLGTYYVPWNVTVGLPLVAATAAWLLWSGPTRSSVAILGTGAATGGVLLALVFWENIDAITSTLATAYPGDRRSSGEPLAPFQLFGAPGLVTLRNDVAPAVLNASEIASAYLVCAVWAVALVPRLRPIEAPRRAFLWVLAGATVVLVLWSTLSWGTLGEHIPLLNLVPAIRAAQTAGYVGALLLCLVLSQVESIRVRQAVPAAAACALVTAWGVSSLRVTALPSMGQVAPFLVPLLVGALVLVVTRWPGRWTVLALVSVLAWSGAHVNPLTFGLGDLRESAAAATARRMAEKTRSEGSYVAADSGYVTALLMGNGVPTLTGYQTSGPDDATWSLLDPDGEFEPVWNRGASFISMAFDRPGGADPVIENAALDHDVVHVDPCAVDPKLRLDRIVTAVELHRRCLQPIGSFVWQDAVQHVYRVTPREAG
jgi:hypothetical protein